MERFSPDSSNKIICSFLLILEIILRPSSSIACLDESFLGRLTGLITSVVSFQFPGRRFLYSSKALFYFAFGLPAFALIKIFSSFLFARHNTKIPFYFSVFSVITNIIISVYYFNKIGFIIIPMATTISSWLNAILLLIYLTNKKYYSINSIFLYSLIKISLSTAITSYIFYNLINFVLFLF